ncbi:glycosyltransferase family 2 protein [Neobacillus sp. C211]|uniref:glycosyltransferase family 2 protein n=1 Tax=unclassified Neobacillus TaxID=2675272 RepID=UPI0039780FB4
MEFEVSVIILSYNRYPLNLFTLYALENQSFDLSKMEVIFIDDASSDNTSLLKEYHPPYSFKYVRNESNLGIAGTRNKGYKMAQGKIILFLDAEIIMHPDYIRNHHSHHMTNEQVVVIGKQSEKLYSFLFPKFNSGQINDIYYLAKNRQLVEERLGKVLQQKINKSNLQDLIKNLKEPIQLLSETEIKNSTYLKSFSVSKIYLHEIFEQWEENFNNSPLAWMACVGSNFSIKRDLIGIVGGYDESFRGWGHEDIEFSYRLYKAGTKFVFDPNLIRYHQEHPIPVEKRKEGRKNMILLQQKHPVIEVCIKSLESIHKTDFAFMNKILQEYKSLNSEFPGRFEDFKSSIVLMLQQIQILKSQEKQVSNLLQSSSNDDDSGRKEIIFSERNVIEAYGNYGNLVNLFDLLTTK